jgi:hypothetical protein
MVSRPAGVSFALAWVTTVPQSVLGLGNLKPTGVDPLLSTTLGGTTTSGLGAAGRTFPSAGAAPWQPESPWCEELSPEGRRER